MNFIFKKEGQSAFHLIGGELRPVKVLAVSKKYAMVRRPNAAPYVASIGEIYGEPARSEEDE